MVLFIGSAAKTEHESALGKGVRLTSGREGGGKCMKNKGKRTRTKKNEAWATSTVIGVSDSRSFKSLVMPFS